MSFMLFILSQLPMTPHYRKKNGSKTSRQKHFQIIKCERNKNLSQNPAASPEMCCHILSPARMEVALQKARLGSGRCELN